MTRIEKEAKTLKQKSMTKKALAEAYAENRVNNFPQGSRTHKSKKDYNRQKAKREVRDLVQKIS